MGLLERASQLAVETPEERNRYVDLLRVVALGAVVLGHWLVIDVRVDGGVPTGVNVLAELSWAHWGTWLFQVIPIFFLVGGYANAVSWRSHRRRGGTWASWLSRRALRLLWPTAIFITVGVAAMPMAAAAGTPETVLGQASWAVAFILWFLAAYLGVAALTPISLRAHDRWGLGFAAALVAGAVIADLTRFSDGLAPVAGANYALVWGTFHQLGFAWRDAEITRGPLSPILGLAAAVILVVWGPYPVSMVGVPGAEMQNTGPPSSALLFFGLAQVGFVLTLEGMATRVLARVRVWTAVVSGNLVVMSVFLWHVLPVVLLAAVSWALGIALPGPVGSAGWLLFRPVWLLLLAAILVPVVLLVGSVERPPPGLERLSMPQLRSPVAPVVGLVGVAAASTGLARLAVEGFWTEGAGPVPAWPVPFWGVASFFIGGALILAGGALGRRR